MKRTASLRFAVLAPGWVSGEETLDRLCLLVSHRGLSETSDLAGFMEGFATGSLAGLTARFTAGVTAG